MCRWVEKPAISYHVVSAVVEHLSCGYQNGTTSGAFLGSGFSEEEKINGDKIFRMLSSGRWQQTHRVRVHGAGVAFNESESRQTMNL